MDIPTMTKMICKSLRAFLTEEDAPTIVEYGILVGLIAVIGAVGVGQFGISLNNLFSGVSDVLP